jgi:transposase
MTTPRLLIELSVSTAAPPSSPRVEALVQRPQRHQVELGVFALDHRAPADRSVREIDAVVAGLHLTMLDAKVRSNAETGGRPTIDPRILLTLWVYGTTQGEVEASKIARRT